jgi:hypothetical protein
MRCNGHLVDQTPTSHEAYHVQNVSSCSFRVGEFVSRMIQMTKDQHKHSLIWEGPFELVEVTQPSLYRLQREDGSKVPNSWNDDQL